MMERRRLINGNNLNEEIAALRGNVHFFLENKSNELKEALNVFNSRVMRAVTTNNRLLQYRIGLDGQLSFDAIKAAPEKLRKAEKELRQKAKLHVRKTVTGDPNKRIRDHMKEIPQVKLIDKLSFSFGILLICLIEFFLLRKPHYFPMFYWFLIIVLFTVRYFEYKKDKFHFFMLDFCYFANTSCILQTFFCPDNELWFKINYVTTHGPLCLAVIVWSNSLVFHSIDKQTSFFLHILPPLLQHIYRWRLVPVNFSDAVDSLTFVELLLYPSIFYLLWLFLWLLTTEVILREWFENDLELITSLRYLLRDQKNPTVKFFKVAMRKIGVLAKDEGVEPEKVKSKIIFVVCQFFYNFFSLIPVIFIYHWYPLTVSYLLLIFFCGVWNGASYYIEVFSKRYNLKFEEKVDIKDNKGNSEDEEYISADEEGEDLSSEYIKSIQFDFDDPLSIDKIINHNESREDSNCVIDEKNGKVD